MRAAHTPNFGLQLKPVTNCPAAGLIYNLRPDPVPDLFWLLNPVISFISI
jgi:hypothetical protein